MPPWKQSGRRLESKFPSTFRKYVFISCLWRLQLKLTLSQYLDEFSKQLAVEVSTLLKETGKVHSQLRGMQA